MSQTKKPAAERNGSTKAKPEKDETRANGLPARNGQASAAGALPAFDPWARASHVALIGLFVIALLWCTYVARPVIVPVLLAWVIATIVLPIVTWLYAHKVPRVVAVLAVTMALLLLIVSLLLLLSTPVTFWLGRATELSVLVKQKLQTMNQPLALLDEARKALNAIAAGGTQPAMKVEQEFATVVTTIFAVLTPAVSQFILFIGALIFYLIYQTRLRNTAVLLFPDRDTRLTTLRILSDVDENMTKYFGTFTVVNLCLGAATVLLTWAVGLPNPLLWGVLAALLNYIPYIGPAIVVATLGVVGLLTYPSSRRSAHCTPDLSWHRHHRGTVSHACVHGPPTRAQSVRRIPGGRLLHLAAGADRGFPGGAAADGCDRNVRSRIRSGKTRPAGMNQRDCCALSS